MELHYYKHTEEDNEYKTWTFRNRYNDDEDNSNEYGWTKNKKPNFSETSPEALQYYKTSNREDLHFINEELKACSKWHKDNLNEIMLAEKHNAKL